jgi:hypothetical protein
VLDTTKFIFDFYAGTFTGLDVDNEPYTDLPGQGILEADSVPELICSSEEVDSMAELKVWMDIDSTFNEYFKIKTYTVVGTGKIDSADLAVYADYELAAGGTETYNQTHFNKVLENIISTDYSFILADRTGSEAKSHYSNLALKNHLINDSKYGLYLVIGGGKDSNFFNVGTTNSSTDIAQYFNSNVVIVVHAGMKKVNLANAGFKEYDSIVKAALVTGRICGLEPATPGTFKSIDIDQDMHDMSEKDQKIAQKYGVLWTKYDMAGEWIIGQSISTLQNNNFLVNSDGTSYEVSVMRIAGQLNKEIIYNAYIDLMKSENGPNRGSISSAVLESWTKKYLKSRTVSDINPSNLILGFEQITIKVVQDAYEITYGFYPNLPINKLLFVGLMLDKSLMV